MNISLDALAVLDAIDRRGSFAAAAEEMHRVPSAVSYTIQKLEQDIGVSLFNRSGHRAVLTEAGQEMLHEGRHLLLAATTLESRVKRVATGYEAELRIAVNDLIPLPRLYPLIGEFYGENCNTRLQLLREVYGGGWDALAAGRADLSLGVPGEVPAGGGYVTRMLGMLEFVFAVAPQHPLAEAPEPLTKETILAHRAIAAADSSRNLAPRTSGILSGQDVLTVPDTQSKLEAHIYGLGVGYLPKSIAERCAALGTLIIKTVEEPKPPTPFFLAWRSQHSGRALNWFVERLEKIPLQDLLN